MTSACRVAVTIVIAAAGLGLAAPSSARDVAPAFMPLGDIADAPSGFVEMCARNAILCKAGLDSAPPPHALAEIAPPAGGTTNAVPQFQMKIAYDVSCRTAALSPSFAVHFSGLLRTDIFSPPSGFGQPYRFGSFNNAQQACETGLGHVTIPAAHLTGVAAEPRAAADLDAAAEFALVKAINTEVNRAIRPMADYLTTGTDERWDRPGRGKYLVGDCEDYAIEKRMRLIEAGFPPAKLSYSAAYVKGYGMHIVLVAHLQSGDVVLDSLTPHVIAWSKVHYSWLRVQSTQDPMVWYRVGLPSSAGQLANAKTIGGHS